MSSSWSDDVMTRNLVVMAKFGKMMMADDCDYLLPVSK